MIASRSTLKSFNFSEIKQFWKKIEEKSLENDFTPSLRSRKRENPIFSSKYITLQVYGTIYHCPIKEEN